MAKFRKNFKKTVWGFFEVEGVENTEEAQEKLDSGDCEVFDNKSELHDENEKWEKVE